MSKTKIKKITSVAVRMMVSFVPSLAVFWPYLAYALTDEELNKICSPGKNVGGICVPEKPEGAPNFETLGALVTFIIDILLLVVGLIAVIFVVIGGYKYITSGEDEEKVKQGKNMIQNALIGMVIVFLAYALVRITVNLVGGRV